MLQKTKVKKVLSKYKIQLPSETMEFLDSAVSRMVHRWVLRCKNGNIKRLTPDLVGYVLPNTVDSLNKDGLNPFLTKRRKKNDKLE